MSELKLPELGEGISSVEVSAVLVDVGDAIRRDQPIIEVETEKANLEVPATADGKVTDLKVKVGDHIEVGQIIMVFENGAAPAQAGSSAPSKKSAGSGAKSVAKSKAPEPAPRDEPDEPEAAPSDGDQSEAPGRVIGFPAATHQRPTLSVAVPAAPSARALARQLGVDIATVQGSGPGGRISREDVKAHAKAIITGGAATAAPAPGAAPALPDFAQWGEVETKSLSSVRRATARAMATSWATVPHVTQFDHADITQLESMRKRFNRRDADGPKLQMTAIVIKMVASVLRRFAKFNASLDLAGNQVIYKKYVHIGVAVDTERGLLVPVIRDVDRKNLVQISNELGQLAERARERKLSLKEMQGGSFTVSNLGGLGTTYFSPIVNWPETAILGVGRAEQQAVYADGRFEPRLMLPLSVSYDHRLIDGADAARFLRSLAEALEQPLLLLLDD